MIHIASSLNLLGIVRQETDAIGVAVSYGKDSFATLDLCCRVFRRVEGYYLYRVRGLRCVAEWAATVKARHCITVRDYPHFDLTRCYRHSVLRPHDSAVKVATVKMPDIETTFRRDAGVDWIAYGWRRNDSFSRALILKANRGIDPVGRRVYPLRAWRRADVYAYLDSRGIPLPPGLGRKDQGGLDFHPAALRWLKKYYPDDYAKWVIDFPFSAMQLVGAGSEK